jgi:hypothetical protein
LAGKLAAFARTKAASFGFHEFSNEFFPGYLTVLTRRQASLLLKQAGEVALVGEASAPGQNG